MVSKKKNPKNDDSVGLLSSEGWALGNRFLDPVITASPGYSFLIFLPDGGWVVRRPIVAWGITDGRAFPILAAYDYRSHNPLYTAILHPDGSVENLVNYRWTDQDTWLETMRMDAKMTLNAKKREAERLKAIRQVAEDTGK
jgi:hypothetical protein